jgi:internalin A
MVRQRWAVRGGVVLGLLVLAAAGRADEAAALRAIPLLGGKVTVDDKQPGKPVVEVNLSQTKVTDAGLKELREFKSLRTLDLAYTQVTDAGLKELKELKSLQSLSLENTQVTDAGLKELKELKNLQLLDIQRTQITDTGLKELKELKSLRELWPTKVTDQTLRDCPT